MSKGVDFQPCASAQGKDSKEDEARRESAAEANMGYNICHEESSQDLAFPRPRHRGRNCGGMRCDASKWVENSSQYTPRVAAYTVKAYTEGPDPFDALTRECDLMSDYAACGVY